MEKQATFKVEAVIASKDPDKLPDFGMGKGVLLTQEMKFTDHGDHGFESALFQIYRGKYEDDIRKEVVDIRWTKLPKARKKK